MVTARRLQAVLLIALCAAVFTPPAEAQGQPASCDIAAQNLYVRDVMTDIYLWYREIPDIDPVAFESPAQYLDAIRYGLSMRRSATSRRGLPPKRSSPKASSWGSAFHHVVRTRGAARDGRDGAKPCAGGQPGAR